MQQNHQISVLGLDNKQYSIADFKAQGKTYNDAVGIILQTPLIGLVLSFDEWQEEWSDTDKVLTEAQSEAVALQTLSGLEHTQRIVEKQKDLNMTAAKRCWQYSKGNLQWYLPSLYELSTICAYRMEINNTLQSIDCPNDMLLDEDSYYWSSSEYSQSYSWYVLFNSGYFDNNGKLYSGDVRAVAAFRPCGSSSDEPRKESSSTTAPSTPRDHSSFDGDALLSDEALITILRERGYTGSITKTLTI